jgi:cytochrome oxidase Cu insertion factor (SCO1/SenC/PrrC family)
MEQRSLPPFWVIFGVGVVVVASLGFILASLGGSAGRPTATPFLPTPVPVATSVPTSLPTTVSVVEPSSPLPTIEALKVAPGFTLEQADGDAFTLSEQLAQGPVVLVFFQRCG